MTYKDVFRVGNSSDDSSSNHELLPSLGNVDEMNSFSVPLEDVGRHKVGAVLGSQMSL